ncbi:ABC1 kinase family protein [Mycobacterium terramassiliense]|uniref:Predicted unusual protein kinase regulating ubiquinone biosynthesis, AarF/ABC1/UbiB family n=1 Tax=Mycobacterium terramassiliense TaxID=1841859 RepID=A0A2U3NGY1_9MYCO|nr:AarF/ABC1/UbiB kinase family protein [Mycobacterium terramassiliense]SPM30704.1 Predicted unusual protein kinase regulating ubiquinone biosynthesis, AarF/ABC1/UbiB family [Mycobacterium terramassiliense]
MGSQDPVPRGRVRRTVPLAAFTARAAGGAIVASMREKTGDVGAVASFHERAAARYTELLGQSKGVLMKAGQLLSMLDSSSIGSGGFSPYQKALAQLQADAPPMEPALAKKVLSEDLGRHPNDLFAEFANEPMAAASIGQVHRAVLHDGRDVAVKIQYPGVAHAIRSDLANAELLATFFQVAASVSGVALPANPRDTAREIAARISEETDYRQEAANITAFNRIYRGHPFIRVPEVIDEASGNQVLTMTFLDGLDWAAAQSAAQGVKNAWAEVIWRFIGGSYRHANLLHGDPHPGNYRFGTDGRVGFVDFGCVTVIPERRRRSFVEMVRAAIDGRKCDMHALMIKTGFFGPDSTLTADDTYQLMAEIGYEFLAPQPVAFTSDSLARAIHGLIDLRSPDHPVRRMSVPDDLAFFSRHNLIMNPLFAALEATMHVRAITDDMDGIAKPITPLGKQHHDWLRERGLPLGLEPHDHP